jgi:hypothetical protein
MSLRWTVALLCASAVVAATTPKFKWSQDDERLYLSISGNCGGAPRTAVATNSTFTYSCGDKELVLHLREDVVPSAPGAVICKPKENGTRACADRADASPSLCECAEFECAQRAGLAASA